MSRSHKKISCKKDSNKVIKSIENRRFRHRNKQVNFLSKDPLLMREVSDQWTICDYKYIVWDINDKYYNKFKRK